MIKKAYKFALIGALLACLGCSNAKYGKCYECGSYYGKRGGNLPGQSTKCPRCGGRIYYPPHLSDEYYEYKRGYGGTED
jgi:DNA-directed RNA polymerase subunit RPC12/RpoP